MTHILLDDICHARQPKIVEVTEVALPVTRCNPGIEIVTAAATVRWGWGIGSVCFAYGSRSCGHLRWVRTEQPKAYVISVED